MAYAAAEGTGAQQHVPPERGVPSQPGELAAQPRRLHTYTCRCVSPVNLPPSRAAFIHIHVLVRIHVRVCVCVCVCVYVCMYIYIHIHTFVYIYIYNIINNRKYTYIYIHLYIYIYIYMNSRAKEFDRSEELNHAQCHRHCARDDAVRNH